MVSDCFRAMPKPDLRNIGLNQQPPYYQSDEYTIAGCCQINSELLIRESLAEIGYAAAKDIFEHQRNHFEKYGLSENLKDMTEKWKLVFIKEMRLLLE